MAAIGEAAGWSRLVAAVADQVVVTTVQDLHRAVSDGTYRWLGPPARPVQRCTDRVSELVYGTVRAGLRGLGEAGAVVASRRVAGTAADPASDDLAAPAGGPGVETGAATRPSGGETPRLPPRSRAIVKARAIAHGVLDEDVLEVAPQLERGVTLRLAGRAGPVAAARLPELLPVVTSRPVIFVHGLVDSEQVWLPAEERGVSLPDAAAELGATPVLVRYGTGRTIARNGRDLDGVLDELLASWPVPVTSLTLVGHSMGGLVARAACAAAAARGGGWLDRLADVVYLGTPHLGSWLEKVANVTSWSLRHATPHSAAVGRLLDARSQGIKDLRFGTTDEAAWPAGRIDGLLTGRPKDAPWREGTRHHLVVGRLHADPGHPVNGVFGDTLVRASSASATGRWRRIDGGGESSTSQVAASHTALPRHPEVARLLRGLLAA